MNRKIILLAFFAGFATTGFSQDTTGSTRPMVIIPFGKKAEKGNSDVQTYTLDTGKTNLLTADEKRIKAKAAKTKKKKVRKG